MCQDFAKKIYYIANARMPTEKAHGIQLAKMCEAFVEHGVDFELVVPHRRTYDASIKTFYGLRVDIATKKLSIINTYAWGRIGFFLGSISFAFGYFFYLLKKRLRGESFVIYTVDIDQFSFFLIPFIGVPYFCEIHDAKKKSILFARFFKHAVGIVTINSIIKKELSVVFGIALKKIIVHPNGIDMAMFASPLLRLEARTRLGLPNQKPIVLYVGKFYDWKGIGDLVIAARLLETEVDVYAIGGDMRELMAASGVKELPISLHCQGTKAFTEIPLWLFAADALLVLGTKQNDYSYLHTSPMKLFEYMASRRPIVASGTPANREIVGDGEALLYESDNPNDLAEKVRYALSHHDDMEKRAAWAYEKVKNFSWDRRSGHILEFMKTHL
ncbi:MAG: glycosyltransferase family 4 protein [Patescibacteria group bacterium]